MNSTSWDQFPRRKLPHQHLPRPPTFRCLIVQDQRLPLPRLTAALPPRNGLEPNRLYCPTVSGESLLTFRPSSLTRVCRHLQQPVHSFRRLRTLPAMASRDLLVRKQLTGRRPTANPALPNTAFDSRRNHPSPEQPTLTRQRAMRDALLSYKPSARGTTPNLCWN